MGTSRASLTESAEAGAWPRILALAIYAPSPHNTQPWRVKIHSPRNATLFMERARLLPDEDTTGHFQRHAMAMFLEAMIIAAANAGWKLTWEQLWPGAAESSTGLIPFAELALSAGAAPDRYGDDLLLRRGTSRLAGNCYPMTPEDQAVLAAANPGYGQRYEQINDPQLIEAILQENIRAVFHDLNTPSYHDEIARWFRYSDAEARSKADGLDFRCMNLPAVELKLMRDLPQIMRWRMTRRALAAIYRRQIGACGQLGMICGRFFCDDATFSSGAYLMRFWLEVTRLGLYIHPFGNMVTNTAARQWLEATTGIQGIWLIFRIGNTDAPRRSLRRSVAEVLVHD